MQFHGIRKWDQERFPGFDLVAYHDHCTDGIMESGISNSGFPPCAKRWKGNTLPACPRFRLWPNWPNGSR